MEPKPSPTGPGAQLPQILFEIGKVIGSVGKLDTLLGSISELVTQLVGADACSIMLLDKSRTRLLGKAAYGLERRDIETVSFRVGEGVAGWVAEHGEPVLIADVTVDPRFVTLPDSHAKIRSMACVPLESRGRRVGVLTTTQSQIGAFDQTAIELLQFVATTMALDVENVRLRRQTITDPLTGAFNREFLDQSLPKALADSDRRNEPLSLAMIDVDHFKQVNDKYGHAVGDQVLAEVATRLRSAIRGNDTLVRYGGEEFLVMLPMSDVEVARTVGERMRSRIQKQSVVVEPKPIEIRISVGIAEHHRGEESPVELIQRADAALYSAKDGGRNRVEVAV